MTMIILMVEVTIKPSLISQLYNITKYRVIFETQKKNGLPLQLFHCTGLLVEISLLLFILLLTRLLDILVVKV